MIIFSSIFFYIFHIFAQNIDCGYTQKEENNVYPCKPQFYYMKVGCKWVYITRTCYHDEMTKLGGRTGLVVIASDSGSVNPGSILGRVGVLFP